MDPDAPFFRFYPGAYASGRAFERSGEECGVCSRPCVWRYVGNVYAEGEPPTVCARCIADGGLAATFGAEWFELHDVELDGADPALEDELLRRTPGLACFNPFAWPVVDGVPMAFVGYGDDPALGNEPSARAAMDAALAAVGARYDGPTPYLLVFREVAGDRWQTELDLD